jgi:hypothetical protein
MIINRLMGHVDKRIDALKQDLKHELAEHFDGRHDDLAGRMAKVETCVDKAAAMFAQSAAGIAKDTAFAKMLAAKAFADQGATAAPETPKPGDPRPIQIDRAVTTDPAGSAQRADLPEYGAVVYLRSGTDAKTGWSATQTVIRAGRDGRGSRVPRRP